jgi:hypothetical protein
VHAHSVFVVLAYATSPASHVTQGISNQLSSMQEYSFGGDDITIAVSPPSADVHAGRPDTEPPWIWTS